MFGSELLPRGLLRLLSKPLRFDDRSGQRVNARLLLGKRGLSGRLGEMRGIVLDHPRPLALRLKLRAQGIHTLLLLGKGRLAGLTHPFLGGLEFLRQLRNSLLLLHQLVPTQALDFRSRCLKLATQSLCLSRLGVCGIAGLRGSGLGCFEARAKLGQPGVRLLAFTAPHLLNAFVGGLHLQPHPLDLFCMLGPDGVYRAAGVPIAFAQLIFQSAQLLLRLRPRGEEVCLRSLDVAHVADHCKRDAAGAILGRHRRECERCREGRRLRRSGGELRALRGARAQAFCQLHRDRLSILNCRNLGKLRATEIGALSAEHLRQRRADPGEDAVGIHSGEAVAEHRLGERAPRLAAQKQFGIRQTVLRDLLADHHYTGDAALVITHR